jgi:hypothetical protein
MVYLETKQLKNPLDGSSPCSAHVGEEQRSYG